MASVEGFVDAYAITDTLSTDKTQEIALEFLETHDGCLELSDWKNFGHNRTASFKNAQDYCKAKNWDLKDSYGLLLDADMLFVPGKLKQHPLGGTGYLITQCAGSLEYPNTRLIRMDYDWVCRGVTHEYWDGPTETIGKDICHIDDHNDGGCKTDKFPRDLGLLLKGLEEEPTNPRYMFYLAQTYHSMGNWEKAIEYYKKRIAAGGWYEEVWYSHYMISKSYLTLGDQYQFEEWALRGYEFHPKRAEGIYQLAKYFREKGQHFKSYHYILVGQSIPMPNDSLFIETDVYNGLFDYEQSVLDFYVRKDRTDGLKSSVTYMLKLPHFFPNVVSNLRFYAQPLKGTKKPIILPKVFGDDFTASAISVISYPIANVRFVNYKVIDGVFVTSEGISLCENACINIATQQVISKMDASTVGIPTVPHNVRGLEDVRVSTDETRKFVFTATVHDYEENAIRIMRGKYDLSGKYSDCIVLPSPTDRQCEKNWLPIAGSDTMIYQWHPFTIVSRSGVIQKTIPTPFMFSLFRGSAPPIRVADKWWALVHFVDYEGPRRYYHVLVEMDLDMKPVRITLPFVFLTAAIEYCLTIRYLESNLYFYAGINEADLFEFVTPVSEFTWTSW